MQVHILKRDTGYGPVILSFHLQCNCITALRHSSGLSAACDVTSRVGRVETMGALLDE